MQKKLFPNDIYLYIFLIAGLPKEDLEVYINSLKEGQEEGPVRISYETLDAEKAFYWRCLGEHFKSVGMDGEPLLDELLPEVSGFCKYIQGYESLTVNYTVSVKQYYYKITVNLINNVTAITCLSL